jgi:hypothetical protein
MDIFPLPQNASFAPPKTPYVATEKWDLQPFMTYAHRKGQLHRVPPSLRHGEPAPEVTFTELLYPTPKEDQEAFYETWFYFGLLAELLCLNQQEDGTWLIPEAQARAELDAVYKACVREDDDGKRYIDGPAVFEIAYSFLDRCRSLEGGLEARAKVFSPALYFAYQMLCNIHSQFDDSIKYAISAMAETAAAAIQTAILLEKYVVDDMRGFHIPWSRNFLVAGGQVEKNMLEAGWCISEIERARTTYQGLSTMSYTSKLDRSRNRRDHSSCNKLYCSGFQIDLKQYKLSHATPDCSCDEYSIDIAQVQRILHDSTTYPILLFERSESGEVTMSVEPYEPGVPYIALSHVSLLPAPLHPHPPQSFLRIECIWPF